MMQCASSTTKATNFSRYTSLLIISLQVKFVMSSSGLMRTSWYSPFMTASFPPLSVRSPLTQTDVSPLELKLETLECNNLRLIDNCFVCLSSITTWSFMREISGDTTIAMLPVLLYSSSNANGKIAKQRLFPLPVGRLINTSLPLRKLDTAHFCWGLSEENPNRALALSIDQHPSRSLAKRCVPDCGLSSA